MTSLFRLIRAIEKEFGECPTWRPLIEAAKEDISKIRFVARERQ